MERRLFSILILLFIGKVYCAEVETEVETSLSPKKYSNFVDLLLNDVLSQEWSEEEKLCYNDIVNILRNVQNSTLWASWIWDSVQLPSGQFYGSRNHLGNFDQCLRKIWPNENPVQTQYCLVDIKLAEADINKRLTDVNAYDTAESYFHIKTEYNLKFNTLSWGVCMPQVCQKQSVDRFIRTLFGLSHMGSVNRHPDIKIQDCQTSRTPPANKIGLYLLMFSAVLLMVNATTCTFITRKYGVSKSNQILMKIVSAFDIKSNALNLIASGRDDIKVLHGIRFVTGSLVISYHIMWMYIVTTTGNALDINDMTERYARYLSHLSVGVSIYFMMSGLLLMKSFKPETGRSISPLKMLLKRYFRLIWVYIVIILIAVTALPYLYDGPLWPKYAKVEKEACEKTWWIGLLMLGNYLSTRDICMQVTWYVPADYHLAAICTVLYWLYLKNRRGGQYLFGVVTFLSLLIPGVYTFINKFNAITVFDFETIADHRKYITGSPMYTYSHIRASSYFVGLIAGYILSVYKPSNYRNVISMKYSIMSFIVIMALLLAIQVIGSTYKFREYNALESAFFTSLDKPIWAALMAAFVMLCEYGTLPLITDFLSWSVFVPLSKLSYGIYMCHFFFVMRLTLNLRAPVWHDLFKLLQDSLGILVVSSVLSLYLTLFLESPLNNLVALGLKTKPKSSEANAGNNEEILKSDSLKENSINNTTTLEETTFVTMVNELTKQNKVGSEKWFENKGFRKEENEEEMKNKTQQRYTRKSWKQDL